MPKVVPDNLAVIVITYNPDENLAELLSKCNRLSRRIVVVDNNSVNKDWIREISATTGAVCILNPENSGIGKAINIAINHLDRQQISWVVTFDQDSLPPDDLLASYNYVLDKERNAGLIGINFYPHEPLDIMSKYDYRESLDQITSGLLHNVAIFDVAGLYNEKLFIDCVDFEYSLRVKKSGFKTLMIDNCFLHHTIGNPKNMLIWPFKIQSMNHSSFRQYYIVRNHIWLAKKYFKSFPKYIIDKFYHLFIRLAKTVLIDDDKKNKMRQIARGVKDGFISNMD